MELVACFCLYLSSNDTVFPCMWMIGCDVARSAEIWLDYVWDNRILGGAVFAEMRQKKSEREQTDDTVPAAGTIKPKSMVEPGKELEVREKRHLQPCPGLSFPWIN